MEGRGLSQIGQVGVPVQDLDRALEFYRDALGMQFLLQVPGMAFFACGSVRLMLSRPEGTVSFQPGSILYYKVDDIERSFESLSARSVKFLVEPHLVARMADHDLWMAFFKDSEGNTLALMSEVRNE